MIGSIRVSFPHLIQATMARLRDILVKTQHGNRIPNLGDPRDLWEQVILRVKIMGVGHLYQKITAQSHLKTTMET